MGDRAPEGRLVGRSGELAKLAEARARADVGEPSVVIVAGEAGIGKSALVAAVLADAQAGGAMTLLGGCLPEGSGGYAFGPFVEMFRSLIASVEPARLPALLGPARGEFSRLMPELADRLGLPAAVSAGAMPPVPVHFYELILGTVERLARNGLLVVAIEDLHWADDASRDLLAFLVRAVRRARILLLLTIRSDALASGEPVVAWLGELERSDRVRRIDLAGLGRADMRTLLGTDAPDADPGLVARVVDRADGNPFYARQLLAYGREAPTAPLPPVLRDVLLARLGTLLPQAEAAVRAASIGGPIVDEHLLATVLRVPSAELSAALREAVRHGLLTLDGDRDGLPAVLRFSHVLLREAVAADLLPGERRALHEAYAEALERDATSEGSPAETTAELARHWDGAQQADRAFETSVRAAQAAADVGAHGDAARLYGRAVELAERARREDHRAVREDVADLLHRAAEASSLAGRYVEAVRLGTRALEAWGDAGPEAQREFLRERLRWYQWESGDVEAALRGAEAAVAELPPGVPSAARSRALTHQAGILMFSGRFDASRPIAEEALAVARTVGALPEAAIATGVLAWDEAAAGAAEQGIARLREALRVAEIVERHEGVALGLTNLTAMLEATGHTAEALAEAEAGLQTLERLGFRDTYGGVLHATASAAAFDLGHWDAARTHAERALEARVPADDVLWVQLAAGRIALGQGRIDEARMRLETARILADRPTSARLRPDTIALLVGLDLEAGELKPARTRIEAWHAATGPSPWPARDAALCALGARVEAEAAMAAVADRDSADRAVAVAAAFRDRSAALPVTDARIRAYAYLAEAEAARAAATVGSAAGTDAWLAAAEAFEALPRPYPGAYARFRLAETLLLGRGSRGEAEAALRLTVTTARGLGAESLLSEALDLARRGRLAADDAAGGAAGTDAAMSATAALRLTPREAEVLRLVAAGRTNREIGEALFISDKTASVHVSNIFGKLQVGNRIEAATMAHRLGLDAEEGVDRPPRPAPARPVAERGRR